MKQIKQILKVVLPESTLAANPITLTASQQYALQAEYFLVKAFEKTVWTYREYLKEVRSFMQELQSEIATESLCTEAGRMQLRALAFENSFNRDFARTVYSHFFTTHAEWHEKWRSFVRNMALGLSYTAVHPDEIDKKQIDTPEEIVERSYSSEEMYQWLIANQWAVVLVMMRMWAVLPEPEVFGVEHAQQ